MKPLLGKKREIVLGNRTRCSGQFGEFDVCLNRQDADRESHHQQTYADDPGPRLHLPRSLESILQLLDDISRAGLDPLLRGEQCPPHQHHRVAAKVIDHLR